MEIVYYGTQGPRGELNGFVQVYSKKNIFLQYFTRTCCRRSNEGSGCRKQWKTILIVSSIENNYLHVYKTIRFS